MRSSQGSKSDKFFGAVERYSKKTVEQGSKFAMHFILSEIWSPEWSCGAVLSKKFGGEQSG
jgi:hypothetical protein